MKCIKKRIEPPGESVKVTTRLEIVMNFQAIISSFFLALGAVLIVIGCNDSTFEGADKMSDKSADVLKVIGGVLATIGGLGFIYTIYEIMSRHHKRMVTGEGRKLEQQLRAKVATVPSIA